MLVVGLRLIVGSGLMIQSVFGCGMSININLIVCGWGYSVDNCGWDTLLIIQSVFGWEMSINI